MFAPFIFIEDPLDVNGQRGLLTDTPKRRMSTFNSPSPGGLNGSGSTLLSKNNKIDPYYLITHVGLDNQSGKFIPFKAILTEPTG